MTKGSEAVRRVPDGGPWLRSGDRTVCQSVGELGALWPGARFWSTASDFYANALRLQFGQFRIETIVNSAFSCARDQALIDAFPRPGISIEIVLEGRQQRQQDGLDFVLEPGQASVTFLDRPFAFAWFGAGRSVRTVSTLMSLPPQLQSPDAVCSGPLSERPLVQSFIGFIKSLVDVAQPDTVNHHALAASATYLHTAVLLDAGRRAVSDSGKTLRSRVEEHIALNLIDPGLSPTSIAGSLGVSVRSVHSAFSTAEITVAAEIRRQRVLAATRLLQQNDPPLSQAAIAARVGFRSKDQLGRSLQLVLGINATTYRNQ